MNRTRFDVTIARPNIRTEKLDFETSSNNWATTWRILPKDLKN